MQNFIIKTHQKGKTYSKPHLFLLNKGLNSGKPQKEPFTNGFVIQFSNPNDAETIYWLAYSLWKSEFWQIHLVGSVIPFLRLSAFKKDFTAKVQMMFQDLEQHQKKVQALRLLEVQEEHFRKNIILIAEMRRVILQRYCEQ